MVELTAATEAMYELELCKHTGCKILTECSTVPRRYTPFQSQGAEQGEPKKGASTL